MAPIAIEIPKNVNFDNNSSQSYYYSQDRIKSKLIYEIQPNELKIYKSQIPNIDILNSLITKFLNDFNKSENSINIENGHQIFNGFINVAGRLFQLNPEKIGVEYSKTNHRIIYFFSSIMGFKIHIEVFFEKTNSSFIQSVVNIYNGVDHILNVTGDYNEVFKAVERFIPKTDPEIYKYISFKSA